MAGMIRELPLCRPPLSDFQKVSFKFIIDKMLGGLAKYMLILGFDTLYFSQNDVNRLIETARKECRVILTRNSKLQNSIGLPGFLLITDDQPAKQLRQVVNHFGITIEQDKLFTRCLHCNQKLLKTNAETIKGCVPPYIASYHQKFFLCPQCKKVYWGGSHYKMMQEMIWKILGGGR